MYCPQVVDFRPCCLGWVPQLTVTNVCLQVHWRTWRNCTSTTTPTYTASRSSWPSAASCPSWALRTVPSATCRPRLSREALPSSSSSSRCRDHTVPWSEPRAAQSQSYLTPNPPLALHPLACPQLRVSYTVKKTDSPQSVEGGKYEEEEDDDDEGENVSFTIPGQKQGESVETWLLCYSRVYHGHFRTPATPAHLSFRIIQEENISISLPKLKIYKVIYIE